MLEVPNHGLVVILRDEIGDVASVCYKNAASSREAIKRVSNLVNGLQLTSPVVSKECADIRCALMSFVRNNGGGICEGFFGEGGCEGTKAMFPLEGLEKVEFRDDNILISTTDEGIWDMYKACIGVIYINLNDDSIQNETILCYENANDYIESSGEIIDYDSLPEMKLNPEYIFWDEIEELREIMDSSDSNLFRDGFGGLIHCREYQ